LNSARLFTNEASGNQKFEQVQRLDVSESVGKNRDAINWGKPCALRLNHSSRPSSAADWPSQSLCELPLIPCSFAPAV
jgi:hypothetical protein